MTNNSIKKNFLKTKLNYFLGIFLGLLFFGCSKNNKYQMQSAKSITKNESTHKPNFDEEKADLDQDNCQDHHQGDSKNHSTVKNANNDLRVEYSIKDLGILCINCEEEDAKLRCADCKKAYYCTKDCQKRHWNKHKTVCKKVVMKNLYKKIFSYKFFLTLNKDIYLHSSSLTNKFISQKINEKKKTLKKKLKNTLNFYEKEKNNFFKFMYIDYIYTNRNQIFKIHSESFDLLDYEQLKLYTWALQLLQIYDLNKKIENLKFLEVIENIELQEHQNKKLQEQNNKLQEYKKIAKDLAECDIKLDSLYFFQNLIIKIKLSTLLLHLVNTICHELPNELFDIQNYFNNIWEYFFKRNFLSKSDNTYKQKILDLRKNFFPKSYDSIESQNILNVIGLIISLKIKCDINDKKKVDSFIKILKQIYLIENSKIKEESLNYFIQTLYTANNSNNQKDKFSKTCEQKEDVDQDNTYCNFCFGDKYKGNHCKICGSMKSESSNKVKLQNLYESHFQKSHDLVCKEDCSIYKPINSKSYICLNKVICEPENFCKKYYEVKIEELIKKLSKQEYKFQCPLLRSLAVAFYRLFPKEFEIFFNKQNDSEKCILKEQLLPYIYFFLNEITYKKIISIITK